MSTAKPYPLSQLDAFFVAYQEQSGILMQLGVEVDVAGEPSREALEHALAYVTGRWPQLGQVLHQRITGLAWSGDCRLSEMLRITRDDGDGIVDSWRNTPIDPFREPPFQMLAVFKPRGTTLAFRAHHAVCDGEALVRVCVAVVDALAQIMAGRNPEDAQPVDGVSLMSVLFPKGKQRWRRLPAMWRHLRRLDAIRRTDPGAPLALRAREPGDVATCQKTLNPSMAQPWLCAAAWVRAIGAWNRSKNAANAGRISLELPISFRSTPAARECAGNWISPLILFGDATRPLTEVAEDLLLQFKSGMRQRLHAAVPLLTAPARYLPWPVFRRLALSPLATGFATSHFTWLDEKRDVYADVSALSGGRLRLLDHRIYAPVCLHMGAALTAFVVSGRMKLCLTYRRTAFLQTEAESLLDIVLSELSSAPALRVPAAR